MSSDLIGFLALLAIAVTIPTILFLLLRSSFYDLLRHTLKLESAITFYMRSFLLALYLSALSGAVGTSFDLKPDAHFMEYVWKGAQGVSSTLEQMLWFVALYLVLVTILVVVLKVKVDE